VARQEYSGGWRLLRARVPVIIHTIHGPSFGQFQSAPANFFFRAAERRAGKVTSHFIVVADAMKQQYLAAGIGTLKITLKSSVDLTYHPFLPPATTRINAPDGIKSRRYRYWQDSALIQIEGARRSFRGCA
jgi:hypothetical protein